MFSLHCGGEIGPDFITRQGMLVYTNGLEIEQREVELAIDLTSLAAASVIPEQYSIEKLQSLFHKYEHRISIFFVKSQEGGPASCANDKDENRRCRGFRCDASSTGWCAGQWNSKYLYMTVVYQKCLGHTSLSHEVAHMLNYLIEGRNDSKHADSRFFPAGCQGDGMEQATCVRASILYRSQLVLQRLTCNLD